MNAESLQLFSHDFSFRPRQVASAASSGNLIKEAGAKVIGKRLIGTWFERLWVMMVGNGLSSGVLIENWLRRCCRFDGGPRRSQIVNGWC